MLSELLSDLPSVDDLGLERDIADKLITREGLTLIVGPGASGKSTLFLGGIRHAMEKTFSPEWGPVAEILADRSGKGSFAVRDGFNYIRIHDLSERERIHAEDPGKHPAHFLADMLRLQPTTLGLDEIKDAEGGVCLMRTGAVIGATGTMKGGSVAEAMLSCARMYDEKARRSDTPSPPANGGRVIWVAPPFDKRELVGLMTMVVAQHLLPKVGGGVVASREYLIFDKDTREVVREADVTSWPALLKDSWTARARKDSRSTPLPGCCSSRD
jgi:hypothetical protein